MNRGPARIGREPTPPGLRWMRRIALGLLVIMAALFLVARSLENRNPVWGYVRAFAEAAMVGGLADWFAVTALFRHPLGLPIPHTAIVPRNKDRIGDTLALFLKTNFLVPTVVARRLYVMDAAAAIVRWLTDPAEGAGGRFRQSASKLVAQVLQVLDPTRLGTMVKTAVGNRLRETDIAPILGQLLTALIAEGRHKPLIEAVIRWSSATLAANDQLVRRMVHERAGAILRWTGLDETVATKLIGGLDKLLTDMADDTDHPIRIKIEEALDRLTTGLRDDPELRARIEAAKSAFLENAAMQRFLDGLWEFARTGLLNIANNPEAAMAGRLGDLLRQVGYAIEGDQRLVGVINRLVRRAIVGLAADYGEGIVRLVSETVRSWDADTITVRLENAVGRDLQYIRINGTLVGGSVGVAIHVIGQLLHVL